MTADARESRFERALQMLALESDALSDALLERLLEERGLAMPCAATDAFRVDEPAANGCPVEQAPAARPSSAAGESSPSRTGDPEVGLAPRDEEAGGSLAPGLLDGFEAYLAVAYDADRQPSVEDLFQEAASPIVPEHRPDSSAAEAAHPGPTLDVVDLLEPTELVVSAFGGLGKSALLTRFMHYAHERAKGWSEHVPRVEVILDDEATRAAPVPRSGLERVECWNDLLFALGKTTRAAKVWSWDERLGPEVPDRSVLGCEDADPWWVDRRVTKGSTSELFAGVLRPDRYLVCAPLHEDPIVDLTQPAAGPARRTPIIRSDAKPGGWTMEDALASARAPDAREAWWSLSLARQVDDVVRVEMLERHARASMASAQAQSEREPLLAAGLIQGSMRFDRRIRPYGGSPRPRTTFTAYEILVEGDVVVMIVNLPLTVMHAATRMAGTLEDRPHLGGTVEAGGVASFAMQWIHCGACSRAVRTHRDGVLEIHAWPEGAMRWQAGRAALPEHSPGAGSIRAGIHAEELHQLGPSDVSIDPGCSVSPRRSGRLGEL